MKRILLILTIAMPVTASADEYHTVEWFRDHPDSRKQTIYWCHNNTGLAPHNPNCPNAEQGALLAEERAMAGKSNSLASTKWWSPATKAMMLHTCDVLRGRHIDATRGLAADCRELGAPGY